MLDYFKKGRNSYHDVSDKRRTISRVIVAAVLIAGLVIGFVTSGSTETEVNIADVFSFRFSIVDAVIIALLFIVYIVIRINRRRNGGK